MEHNSPKSQPGSDPQDSALTAESASNNEDEEEFDAYGFSISLAKYISNPTLLVDIISVNDAAITTFIKQINHPQAKDLKPNCFRQYNNETESGLWIQETAFKFHKPWIPRCEWKNCGELAFIEAKVPKAYKVFYWRHKKIPDLRFRKYCIPGLELAAYVVFSEPSSKKRKITKTNQTLISHESTSEVSFQPNSYQLAATDQNIMQQTQLAYQSPISFETHNMLQNNNNQMGDYDDSEMQFQKPYDEVVQNNNNQMGNYTLDQNTQYQQLYTEAPQNNNNQTSYDNFEQPMPCVEPAQLPWYQLQVLENTERSKKNEQEIAKLKEQQVQTTAEHVRLDLQTVSNTREIEELTNSVATLEIHSKRQIVDAIIKILRGNKGSFPAVAKFASKVRELLNDQTITTKEVNNILTNILEKRGVVKRSSDRSTWILNEDVWKKFDLNTI